MVGWLGAQGSVVHSRGRGPRDVPLHTAHIPGRGAGTVEARPALAPSPEAAAPVGPRPPPSPRPGPGPSRTPPAPGRPKPLLPPLTSEGGHMTPRGPIARASLPQSPRQPARPPPAAHTSGRTRTHAPHSAPARGRDTPAPAVPGAAPNPEDPILSAPRDRPPPAPQSPTRSRRHAPQQLEGSSPGSAPRAPARPRALPFVPAGRPQPTPPHLPGGGGVRALRGGPAGPAPRQPRSRARPPPRRGHGCDEQLGRRRPPADRGDQAAARERRVGPRGHQGDGRRALPPGPAAVQRDEVQAAAGGRHSGLCHPAPSDLSQQDPHLQISEALGAAPPNAGRQQLGIRHGEWPCVAVELPKLGSPGTEAPPLAAPRARGPRVPACARSWAGTSRPDPPMQAGEPFCVSWTLSPPGLSA